MSGRQRGPPETDLGELDRVLAQQRQAGRRRVPREAPAPPLEEPEDNRSNEGRRRSPPSSQDEQTSDTELEARLEEARQRVRRLRKKQELESLTREAAGEQPTVYVPIEGTSLPARHKRGVSDSAEASLAKHIKLSDAPLFHGKSIKELQRFNTGWMIIFCGEGEIPEDTWQTRIDLAGKNTREIAADAWAKAPPLHRWQDFIDFLQQIVVDPEVRMVEAIVSLNNIAQKEGQSARKLKAEIESLKEAIPSDMPQQVREAWTLLLKLRPALRRQVMSDHKTITSREQVLASASKHEGLAESERKAESQATRSNRSGPASTTSVRTESHEKRTVTLFPRKDRETPDKSARKTATPAEDPDACWLCKKKGHTKKDCPERGKLGMSKSDSGKSHDKGKGKSKN